MNNEEKPIYNLQCRAFEEPINPDATKDEEVALLDSLCNKALLCCIEDCFTPTRFGLRIYDGKARLTVFATAEETPLDVKIRLAEQN